MDHKVFKYSIPVDDNWHEIDMPPSGPVLLVGSLESPDTVQFWVEVQVVEATENRPRSFRVFGTGHFIPDEAIHQGSVIVAGGALVWHLYEDWDAQSIRVATAKSP